MKRILQLLVLFISVKSFSQNAYTPINFDTSCYWVNELNIYLGGTICAGTLMTYIEKDTIINSLQYFRMTTVAASSDVGGNCVKGYNQSVFVREDTSQRKIFKYISGNIEETLLDFNLNTGDTIEIGIGRFQIDSVSIDTIYNIPRRRQWYHEILGGTYSTIEGIGNTMNFPYTGYGEWDTPYFKLLCFGKNGTTYYGQNSCMKLAPLSITDASADKLFVQVAENILTVETKDETSVMTIYNILGNPLYSEKIHSDHYTKDLSADLHKGFYVICVSGRNGKTVLKVVVK
ncbi:MAG: T9SS type A sorting domain-containing protein [Chitinophagaceae bacterium]|nr:T9SS type A sorting domain-containing protein [Chitinophagaceae bacterium]